MAYSKTNWQDLPNTTTPITATRLNNMETGIENNDKRLNGTSVSGDMVVSSIRTKNLFSSYFVQGSVNGTTGEDITATNRLRSGFIQLDGGTYTISLSNTNCLIVVDVYGTDETFKSSESFVSWNNAPFTFSLSGTRKIKILICFSNNATIVPSDVQNFQLEEGSTATTYSAYQSLKDEVITGSVILELGTSAVEMNKYAKCGKVASLKLTLTVSSQINANATTRIGTGLPIPNNAFFPNGWEFFGVSKSDKSNIRCRIDPGGVLIFWYLNNQIASGTQLYFFTTYVTEE